MDLPEDLKYTENHEWIKVEGKNARVGISDHAQKELGDIVYVELPMAGDQVAQGENLAVVESVKSVSDVYAPVDGEVVEVNEELQEAPEIINESAYGEGWFVVIQLDKPEQVDSLLTPQDYKSQVE
ncbi:MAG: glycine cleavage system protein GcvH [Candidatus Acetothermia bacterium]